MKFRNRSSRPLMILACVTLALRAAIALPAPPAAAPAAPVLTPAPAPAQPLTVDEAVAFALKYNPAVTLAQQNVQVAQAQVGVARSKGSPQVGVGVSASWTANPTSFAFGDSTVSFPALSVGAQLTVSQPIWPSTQWTAPVRIARA
ncbi:MAG TPA: TolC family protein, partial [Armatimonadota bacterium]